MDGPYQHATLFLFNIYFNLKNKNVLPLRKFVFLRTYLGMHKIFLKKTVVYISRSCIFTTNIINIRIPVAPKLQVNNL